MVQIQTERRRIKIMFPFREITALQEQVQTERDDDPKTSRGILSEKKFNQKPGCPDPPTRL